jgi:regulator of protease activity HflC (stomatin/prohibitin superfamily)
METETSEPPPTKRRRRWTRALEILTAASLAPWLIAIAARKIHGNSELVRVGDDQVAVVLNRWTGEMRATSVPGLLFRIPWLQEITLLDRSPSTIVIRGATVNDSPAGADPDLELDVRSSDGSSFRVDEIVVQFAIVPESAVSALDELGFEPAAPHAVLSAHARSILRDELGRATAEEISRGEKTQEVVNATTARLQAAVAPHGIAVLGVSFAKPRFDEVYEDTISRAKTFRQQADELSERTEQLERGRAARESAVVKKKEIELAKLVSDLVRDRGHAVRDAKIARQEADDYFRARTREGEAAKLEKEAQAALVEARNIAAAGDVEREGAELEAAGDLPVRKALVERLGEIQIDLVPRPRPEGARSAPEPTATARSDAPKRKP